MVDSTKHQFFVTRENGKMVPLIAADEIPSHLDHHNLPCNPLPYGVSSGPAPGSFDACQRSHIVDSLRSSINLGGRSAAIDRSLMASIHANPHARTPSPSYLGPRKTYGITEQAPGSTLTGNTNSNTIPDDNSSQCETVPPSTIPPSPLRVDRHAHPLPPWHDPSTLPIQTAPGVKEYCSYWLRHGECDYAQQGCLYKHEMPLNRLTLERLGLRDIPRWYREKHGLGSYLAGGGILTEDSDGVKERVTHKSWRAGVGQRRLARHNSMSRRFSPFNAEKFPANDNSRPSQVGRSVFRYPGYNPYNFPTPTTPATHLDKGFTSGRHSNVTYTNTYIKDKAMRKAESETERHVSSPQSMVKSCASSAREPHLIDELGALNIDEVSEKSNILSEKYKALVPDIRRESAPQSTHDVIDPRDLSGSVRNTTMIEELEVHHIFAPNAKSTTNISDQDTNKILPPCPFPATYSSSSSSSSYCSFDDDEIKEPRLDTSRHPNTRSRKSRARNPFPSNRLRQPFEDLSTLDSPRLPRGPTTYQRVATAIKASSSNGGGRAVNGVSSDGDFVNEEEVLRHRRMERGDGDREMRSSNPPLANETPASGISGRRHGEVDCYDHSD